jgi:hypothetical protein
MEDNSLKYFSIQKYQYANKKFIAVLILIVIRL